jgi:membrane fusion protein, heavy metal efflux system
MRKMMKKKTLRVLPNEMRRIFLLLIISCVLGGCSKSPQASQDMPPGKGETYKVSSKEVTSFIDATGSIQPDIAGSAKVMSHLPGTVDNILVKVGDQVMKGDVLASIRSPEVSDAYSGYLSSLSQVKQTERLYNLNKQLFEIGAVTKNDFINSEANFEQVKAILESSKMKLDIYGVKPESGFSDKSTIKSPMNGTVVEIQAHIGDRVDTSNPILLLADPNKIMVVANIYDTDIPGIQRGKQVDFYADIHPDRLFKGIVFYISDISDADSKTVKTYIRITDESSREFKQNMFLKMRILKSKKKLFVLPKTAMLYKDGKFIVFLVISTGYKMQEIKPVQDVSDKLMAVEGVKEGDEVLLSAMSMEKT